MRNALCAAAVTAALVASGCGDVPRSNIHGTVKYQGRPLASGMVIFLAKDNKTHLVDLNPDGTYQVTGVARGPVKVSIQQLQPRPYPKSEQAADEKDQARRPSEPKSIGPRIPASYADPEQSGLLFELREPDQEWSVDLQ